MKRLVLACVALPFLASPALAAKPPWRLVVDGDGASLTNAIPDSDDAATMLQCRTAEGTVTVYLFLETRVADHLKGAEWVDKAGRTAPWSARLTVTSGGVTGAFPAKANPDEQSGGTEVEATIPASAPVMAAFARTGAIHFTAFGERVKEPPIPAAKAAGLMRVCRK